MLDPEKYFERNTRLGDKLDFTAFRSDIDAEIKRLTGIKKELSKIISKAKKLEEVMNKFMWLKPKEFDTPKGKRLESKVNELEKEILADLQRIGMLTPETIKWRTPDWDGIRILE